LSLQPQYAPNRSGPNAVVGYQASNRVTVKLRDVARVAGVIDTLVAAGANNIGGINFMVFGGIKAARRTPRAGDCRCPPQGRDLRQGRRRRARLAGQHFGRGLARPDAVSQNGRRHGGLGAGRAGRRNAAGHGQRVLGDQA